MGEKNKKQQIIIKICCVLAAFGLWLYTTSVLNPISTSKKNISVIIKNEDVLYRSNLVLVPNQNFQVTLNLKGPINDIYAVKEQQFRVVLNLDEYVLKKGENNIPVHIEKSPANIKIINSNNLWVKVNLDKLTTKKIPLKLKVAGKAKEGYYPLTGELSQKRVSINGPSKYIDLAYSAVANINITNLTQDIDSEVEVKVLDQDGEVLNTVKSLPKTVRVKVPIRRTKTVPINIKTTGELDNKKQLKDIISLPDKVNIVGEKNIINNITSLDTEIINLSNVINGEIDVKLNVPRGVTLVNNNGYVKVKLQLDKVDESKSSQKEVSIPIKTLNLDNKYVANLDNNNISLVLTGDDKILNSFDGNTINCFVDLNSLKEGQYSLPITVNLPKGIKAISISPQKVNVNLKKNQISEEEYVNTNK